ncbi:MAG: T9SS type A sorting domain-containing protein [Paludibacter sp.]|nr:T9SS type A sorting domain-containing protein [Paludibacter sp.]
MKMKIKILTTIFFLSISLLSSLNAAVYYVATTGNNSNNGTTLSTPLKTIQAGIDKAQVSGDIVYVLSGTYVETLYIWQSGISVSAYTGNSPIIDGGTTLPGADWGSLILIEGNNNTFSGFEVKNSNINGLFLGGYGIQVVGNNNTLNNMKIHHTWEQGVMLHGDYNIVEYSTVYQCAYANHNNTGQQTSGWGMGISAGENGNSSAVIPGISSYSMIRHNIVYNNWGEGIGCFAADHCTIEDNAVYDNWATNLYLSDATNSLVQRNIVYISSAPAIFLNTNVGIGISDEKAQYPRSTNNNVINNFTFNTVFDAFSWTYVPNAGLKNVLIANNTIVDGYIKTGSTANSVVNTNSQIRNNIILGSGSSIPSNTGITFSNNNWSVTPPTTAASTSNVIGDPKISRTGTTTPGSLTSEYFKLQGTSPSINKGITIATVTTDYFNMSRPQGSAYDIGGHEYIAPADNQAPTIPTGLLATSITSSSFTISWIASTDNVGVIGYDIYKDGIFYGSSTTTSLNITGLNASSSYSMTVNAKDAAGNVSGASNALIVTTTSASPINLLQNSGFESGTTNWTVYGGTIATTTTQKYSGNSGCSITNRTLYYAGPNQDVTASVASNGSGTYYIEFFAKMVTKSSTVYGTLKYQYNNTWYYISVSGTVSKSAWTKVSGNITVAFTGTLQNATFYLQTASTDLQNFYADDCVLKFGTGPFLIKDVNTEIQNVNQPEIGIYPNPANDFININIPSNLDKEKIKIYNYLGETVKEFNPINSVERLDISNLPFGCYFVKYGSNKAQKFIKK